MMDQKGFGPERSREIADATFALAEWFRTCGIEGRPEAFMRLLSLIVVAEDQTLSEADIKRGQELAKARGWLRSGIDIG